MGELQAKAAESLNRRRVRAANAVVNVDNARAGAEVSAARCLVGIEEIRLAECARLSFRQIQQDRHVIQ